MSSPIARVLASELAPPLVHALNERRRMIVHAAGGMMARASTEFAWPILMREVPAIFEASADAILDKLASMPSADAARILAAHRGAKGIGPD